MKTRGQVVSNDNGATFGPPTPVFPDLSGVSLFLGSCRGAQLSSGPRSGRLLFVGYNHSLTGDKTSAARVWSSDDSGQSWVLAPDRLLYMGEPQVCDSYLSYTDWAFLFFLCTFLSRLQSRLREWWAWDGAFLQFGLNCES